MENPSNSLGTKRKKKLTTGMIFAIVFILVGVIGVVFIVLAVLHVFDAKEVDPGSVES